MRQKKVGFGRDEELQWERLTMAMAQVPARPPILSVLKSSTLLNSIDESELILLAKDCHMAYAERGETIWVRGDQVDFFGLVGTGFVKMVRSTAKGQEVTAEIMGPGQIFGMLGAIEGSGCPLTSRAVSNCWYLKLPKRVFAPVYERQQLLKDAVLRRTAGRLRLSHEMIAAMASGRVDERIALVLYLLAESYGETHGDSVTIKVPLTRMEISEMAGTTVETTIRVISRWQKENLVETDHRHITIKNAQKLFGGLET